MPYDSDIDGLSEWLDAAIDEIGWDMPAGPEGATLGGAMTLGEAAVETAIDGIQARALSNRGADALGGDDEEWLENHPDYRARKRRTYGEDRPNRRTGQMLSRESLKGTPQVGKAEVVWPYGTGTASPAGRTRRDRTVTDTQKARYAESGQSEHDIRRPLFALTEQDADDVLIVVESAVAEHFIRKAAEA